MNIKKFILILLVLVAGGGCGEKKKDFSALVDQGKQYLAEGDGAAARVEFQKILAEDSKNCEGLWGLALSDLEGLFDLEVLMQSLVSPSLDAIRGRIEEIAEKGEEISGRNCRFELAELPLRAGMGPDALLDLTLGEKWDGLDGEHLANIFGALLAGWDFLLAHNLAPSVLLGGMPESDRNISPVIMLRSFGQLIEDNPEFLAADPENWDRIGLVPGEMARSLEGIARVIRTLLDKNRVKNPGASEIFSVSDVDEDGLDAGDEIVIGVKHLKLLDWESDGPIRIRLSEEFTREFWEDLAGLLEKSASACEGDGELLLKDLNPILARLGVPALPETLALKPSEYFKNPKPIRDYLPYRVEVAPGKWEFLVEGEARPEANEADGRVIFDADSPHFPDSFGSGAGTVSGLKIAADGAGPGPGLPIGISLYYFAFPDPSLSGELRVKSGENYLPADSFTLNQAINRMIVSWHTRTAGTVVYETDLPVLKPDARVFIGRLDSDVVGSTRDILGDFGISDIIHAGDQVYIKVNLGGGIPGVPASYTDPLVVEGVIREVQALGGTPHVCEADMRTYTMDEEVLRKRGYDVILGRTGADFLNLSNLSRAEFHPYDGTIPFDVPAPLREPGSKIISVAVPKHHWECGVSLAQKNMYGAIAERRKSIFHRKYDQIDPVVAAAARAMRPDLSIIGGRAVCGKLGPHLCVPVRLDYLIVSNDMLAADKVGSDLLGYPYEKVKYAQINLKGQALDFSWVAGSEQFPAELLDRVKGVAMTPDEVEYWKDLLFSQYFVPHWMQYEIIPHLEFFFLLANDLFYTPLGDQIDWSL
jgi:uncharacterized protein (DUF362 family)